jgi:hypothetical protein
MRASDHSLEPKHFALEQRKLELELDDLEHARAGREKRDAFENAKRDLELKSLKTSVDGFNRYEVIRVWAPAVSLFVSVAVAAATLFYQNYHDHEFRVSQEMVALVSKMSGKEDKSVQIGAAHALGLFGKGVETVLVANLNTEHDNEFYNNIAPALIDSIRHGNDPLSVVSNILSKISWIVENSPNVSDLPKLKRYVSVLREVAHTLRDDGQSRMKSLDARITSTKNAMISKINRGQSDAKAAILEILNSMSN